MLFGTTHSLELVVHGGGHSSGGSSSTDGGISIDLSKMRACTVNPEKKTINVQGGALWKDVDEALGPYGLATVGGTVNHTGGDLSPTTYLSPYPSISERTNISSKK